MTREEAIHFANCLKENYTIDFNDMEAFCNIAIKALEQKPCEDAISRQVVKEQMIKYGFHAPDMTVSEFVEGLPPVTPKGVTVTDFADKCRECGKLKKGKWIPVSERLPEYETYVLTCSDGGYVEIQSLEKYGEYWEDQKGDWSDLDEIIAWMPLPKPYKKESEEE